jgi:flavodoxin
MARILVIYFSQSGQQREILNSLAKPFLQAGDQLHFEELKPTELYPFPWTAFKFFNAFPETFFQQPLALQPLSSKAFEEYDLVILGYQPWFLTPSRPVSSFLQSEEGKKVLKDKTVVTILGCRNMWLGAQEKVKVRLKEAGATLVGHIALDDRSGNLVSLITILRWLLWGKKEAFWFFPAAGVSQSDIEHTAVFGEIVKSAVKKKNFQNLQQDLNKEGAIVIRPSLVLMEKRGQRGFGIWSKFIAGGGAASSTSRKVRVYTFMYVLPTAIVILTPLLWILSNTMLILLRKKLLQEIEYYKGVSLR